MLKNASVPAIATLMGLTAIAHPATAGSFTTTLSLSPANVDGIDTIVLNFSTDLTSGTVTENDLTIWNLELLAGSTSIFSDNIVSSGTLLPSSFGFTRTIDFDFNLDTSTLNGFDNAVNGEYNDVSYSGVFYNPFNISSNQLEICKNTDGGNPDDNPGGISDCDPTSTFTQETTQATPEPSSLLALLGLGLGILATKVKKQA